MKFQRIEIDAFGALSKTEIDGLAGGANVLYGPNGAGKTTLLHFLRGLFCGYGAARKLGLLPASVAADDDAAVGSVNSRPGGGSVDLTWRGGRCRFARAADSDVESTLRLAVVRSDGRATESSSTSAPCLTSEDLPTDLIPLLYTAGHADANAIDMLVQRALEDGIELVAERRAKRDVDPHPTAPDRDRLAEIHERRRQIQRELQQLRSQLEERCRLVTENHRARKAKERLDGRGRVDWLHAELQAAESDLREAEDRLWRQSRPQSLVSRKTAPLLRLRRDPSTRHVDVDYQKELEEIDRGVAAARSQLAVIAKARLDVNLRLARIAGTPTLPTDEFLKKLRTSFSVMEDALLELQENAERTNTSQTRQPSLAGEWSSTVKRTAEDVRRRLYGTCEVVSQFEQRHLQAQWEAESVRLDQDEQAQLRLLRELEEQRQQLIARTGHLTVWRGSAQRAAERELCECTEHESFEERRSTDRAGSGRVADATAAADVTSDASDSQNTVESRSWPTRQDVAQLRSRCDRLRTDLDKARAECRAVMNRRDDFELPHDVQTLDRRVAQKQRELDAVERELSHSQLQQRVPSGASDAARDPADATERDVRPECIQWASESLLQLTDGRYEGIRIMPGQHDGLHELRVVDEQGTEHGRQTLSRGLLGQLALSLRLALVRAYAKRGVRFPLVFDDILVDCDVERLRRAVQLLKEFADEQGQQILYLTCGMPVVRLFESVGATVRTLPGWTLAVPRQETVSVERGQWSVQGWIDNRSRKSDAARSEQSRREDPSERSKPETPTPVPTVGLVDSSRGTPAVDVPQQHGDSRVVPLRRRQPGGPYWLTADCPLVLVPSIGEQMGRRMTALGIRTVSDLLGMTAEESLLPLRSLQVDVGRLREWQAEALLLSCVPDMAGPDAQLLVACGVHGPAQLAECDMTELVSRLDRFTQRNRESHIGANLPTREDLERWIHNARRARSPEEARRESSRRRRHRGEEVISHPMTPQSGRSTAAARDETVPSNETVPLRETVEKNETVAEEDGRAEEARAVVARFVPSAKTSTAAGSTQRTFYLSPESPVVDAPSIGPKMASRLETLGIITVGDLLARKATEVAGRLKQRRVKAETVTLWQQQARLMCRIPQLRGHDAQVLVACDITEPEQVAGLDARTLFGIVGPFVATREGQRLLRSSKTPDLQEVAEWIDWANHARPLRAA